MKVKIFFSLIVLISICATSQIVDIPDTNFKNALLNHNPVIDTNEDGEIQVTEAQNLFTNLIVSFPEIGEEIEDLTGIEAFINIESLSISQNNISSLDTTANTNLKRLFASGNTLNFSSINLNPGIDTMTFIDNNFETFDSSDFPNLLSISLSENPLNSLNLASATSTLATLAIINTNLTTFDISPFQNLVNLSYGGSQTGEIDLSQNSNIVNLTLDSLNFIPTLSTAPQVVFLTISNSPINELDLSTFSNLIALTLIEIPLDQLDLNDTNLSSLVLIIGNYDVVGMESNTNLTSIRLSDLPQINVPSFDNFQLLQRLSLQEIPINNLDLSTNQNLWQFSIQNNPINILTLPELPIPSTFGFSFTIRENNIENLDVSNFFDISSLRVTDNPNLQYINFKNGNNDSGILPDFQNNPNLELVCVDNTQFAIDNFTNVSSEVTFIEDCTLSIKEITPLTISLYPNPVSDILTIESVIPVEKVTLLNMLGQIIKTTPINDNTSQIDMSALQTGIYFIKTTAITGAEAIKRLIKE